MRTLLKLFLLLVAMGSVFSSVAAEERSKLVVLRAHVSGKVVSSGGTDYVKLSVNGENVQFNFTSTSWTAHWSVFEFEANLNESLDVTVTESGMSDYRVSVYPVISKDKREFMEVLLDEEVRPSIDRADISSSIEIKARFIKQKEPAIPLGKAISVVNGGNRSVFIGLGRASMGHGAGKIILRPEAFENNSFSTTDAEFSAIDGNYVDITSSGTHRQAFAPEGLADIQKVSGKIVIKYYEASQVGAKSGGIYALSGSPFVTYEVSDPVSTNDEPYDPTGYEEYREFLLKRIITGQDDKYIRADETVYRVWNADNAVWEAEVYTDYYPWYESWGTHETKHYVYNYSDSGAPGVLSSVDTVDSNDNTVEFEIFDSGNSDVHKRGVGSDLVTVSQKYSVYTYPDSWEWEAIKTGIVSKTLRFKSSNLGSEPKSAVGAIKEVRSTFKDTYDSLITTYSYWEDSQGDLALPDLIQTKKGSQIVQKMTATYSEPTLFSKSIIQKVETNYSFSGESYQTTTKSFRPDDSDDHLKGKTISIARPDGTKTTYLIQKGYSSWNGTKYVFSENSSYDEIRVVTLNGKSGSSGAEAVTHYDSKDIDDLYMEKVLGGTNYGKNLAVEEWYDAQGRIQYKATKVYTGSGNFTEISHRKYLYNEYGQKVDEFEFIGSPIYKERDFYDATYENGLLKTEKNEQGILTEYDYDDHGRLNWKKKYGVTVTGFDSQKEIITTYTHNAAGRILTETVKSWDSAISLTKTYTYNTAGLLKTSKNAANNTTTFTYTSDTSTKITYPNGGTRITTLHKDGRVKSVTGTAQPTENYTYDYDIGGTFGGAMWVKKTYGTGPWTKNYTDWIGRPHRNVAPSTNNAGDRIQEFHYNNTTGLLEKETFKTGSTTIAASKLYQYDAYARLFREATDTDNDGVIDLSSDHGVLEYFGHYQTLGSDWYRYDGKGVYGTDSSSTMKTLSSHYKQLGPFNISTSSDSVIGYSFTQDKYGNYVQDYVKLRRSQAKLITQHYVYETASSQVLMNQKVIYSQTIMMI